MLFDPNPGDASGGVPPVETNPNPNPPAPSAAPAPAPPPTARTVIEGEITEDTVALKKKLEQTESEKRRAEVRAAELENENIELRRIPRASSAPTAPRRKTFADEITEQIFSSE
jgi:hypothetical protein